MSELTPEERAQRNLSFLRQAARVSPILRDALDAVADHIAKVEAERDALREALAPLMSWPDGTPKRWVADDGVSPIEAEALMTVRALLDPEDGGESSVWVSAQPMSPTMRQAVAEAKQRPPARHFEPSTLLEGGETDE